MLHVKKKQIMSYTEYDSNFERGKELFLSIEKFSKVLC